MVIFLTPEETCVLQVSALFPFIFSILCIIYVLFQVVSKK